ncbi:MAG: hypothetical protein ACPIOQ_55125, partial [Promethearchaeia archaeon]
FVRGLGPGRGLVQPGMCVAARECVCADKRTDTEHDGLDSLQSRILSSLCMMHPCPTNATPTHCERSIIFC